MLFHRPSLIPTARWEIRSKHARRATGVAGIDESGLSASRSMVRRAEIRSRAAAQGQVPVGLQPQNHVRHGGDGRRLRLDQEKFELGHDGPPLERSGHEYTRMEVREKSI